ncbi:MAG: hypothetical protein ACRDZN_01615 [Acidimicrobiales bacterium]
MPQTLYRLGRRLTPLTGAAFFVLIVLALIIEGSPPAADDATEDVVRWWTENDTRSLAAAQLGGLASALLVWFGASVRATLRRAEGEPGRIAAIAFGGFLIAGVGLASIFGFVSAAAETAGDVPAEVTHTLSVLSELFFIPFTMGLLVALLATSVVILGHGGLLPRWLGFVTIVIAIAFLTPAGLGAAIATAVWILYVSVLLFLREEPATSAEPGPAG